MLKSKYLCPILCLYFGGPEAMRGNDFKEKMVVPLMTLQDVYYMSIKYKNFKKPFLYRTFPKVGLFIQNLGKIFLVL